MEFFVLFPTTAKALQKIIPAHDDVMQPVLVGSKVEDLEANWVKNLSLTIALDNDSEKYDVIAVFRLNDMNHDPPAPGWQIHGAMDAGYYLDVESFFGQTKPWRVYSIEK